MLWGHQVSDRIQAVKGMKDILPHESFAWHQMENIFRQCMFQYGYQELRLPLLENTKLFKRTIGDLTDIVEKEMYTFTDLNGESITLRPEGTAGCVRACIEHGLLHHNIQKIWYLGPMFRHERPQKGRYRQFYQLGVEAIGIEGIYIELELILLTKRLWALLGISSDLTLEINTIGSLAERNAYKKLLIDFLKPHIHKLDEDSQRRLERNPLRILDSKNESIQEIVQKAPKLLDCVGTENKSKFENLCNKLSESEVNFTINPFLVRGLDYYSDTVFEWKTDKLGSQSTVCAGGRFDGLFAQLGAKDTPGAGFALGMERLLLLQEVKGLKIPNILPMFYFIAVGDNAIERAIKLAEFLRQLDPAWQVLVNTQGGSFKSQFKKADKSGARIALILGEDEINNNEIGFKDLREDSEQINLKQSELSSFLQHYTQNI